MKSLLLLSLLVVPSLTIVSVSTQIVEANSSTILSARDVQVIATDLASGEKIAADQDGVLNLPEGAYHLSGEGNFCFLVEQNVVITKELQKLSLQAACE